VELKMVRMNFEHDCYKATKGTAGIGPFLTFLGFKEVEK